MAQHSKFGPGDEACSAATRLDHVHDKRGVFRGTVASKPSSHDRTSRSSNPHGRNATCKACVLSLSAPASNEFSSVR
jgi:hypothetical protein